MSNTLLPLFSSSEVHSKPSWVGGAAAFAVWLTWVSAANAKPSYTGRSTPTYSSRGKLDINLAEHTLNKFSQI